jgi:hypothetical protein
MKFDDAPRLSKVPFILGNLALLALAWFIYAYHPNPFSPFPLFIIFVCFVVGILASMYPFVINYVRAQADASTSLRHELDEQFKRLIAASEHLQNSILQLKSVGEIATKNVETAERLPSRLQERIVEFNQQLAAAENKDKARLEQELARLRSGESERQASAAAQIATALAEWTKLEADARRSLSELVHREKESFEQQAATLRAIDSERQAATAGQITTALAEWAKIEADARRALTSMVQREKESLEQQAVTLRANDNESHAAAAAQIATALAEWTRIEADARRSLTDMVQQEKRLFEQQVVTLRSTENERLAAAAEEITMTLASWTGIEAGVRRQLTAATDLQEKLGGVLFSLAGRIADLQAAVESAGKAAEAIPAAPAPSPIILPSRAPAETAPIAAAPEPVEPVAVAPSQVVVESVSAQEPVPEVPPDGRVVSQQAAADSAPPEMAQPAPAMVIESPAIVDHTPLLVEVPVATDSNSAAPETIVPPPPLEAPTIVQGTPDTTGTDTPVSVSTPEIEPSPLPSEPTAEAEVPASFPIDSAESGLGDLPAVTSGEGWVLPMSDGLTQTHGQDARATTDTPPAAPSESPAAAEEPKPISASEAAPQPEPSLAAEPAPEVFGTTPSLELSDADSPAGHADELDAPASPSDTSDPAAPPKPRKPRAPRKPKPESIAPSETVTELPVGAAPAAENPIAHQPPIELIAEPVVDDLPAPENFSQVPPEENKPAKPAGNPSPDGRTRLTVTSYIGIGNKLHIRGEGAGLSWNKGVALQFVSIGRWRWETDKATAPVVFKIYKNDRLEAPNGEITLLPGNELEISATF